MFVCFKVAGKYFLLRMQASDTEKNDKEERTRNEVGKHTDKVGAQRNRKFSLSATTAEEEASYPLQFAGVFFTFVVF
jgi:hypothetical protein